MGEKKQKRAAQLLDDVAAALNALTEAGYPPRVRHGAVYTDLGYVLPPLHGEEWWVARPSAHDPGDPRF
jgi:hypothetical protein